MFMTIIWNTTDGAEVKHLNETSWLDASKFLIQEKIEFGDLKCVEVEDDKNHDTYTIIRNFEEYFYTEEDLADLRNVN